MKMLDLLTISMILLTAGAAPGATIQSYAAGTGPINNPAIASPGTSFSLDYSPILGGCTAPHEATMFLLAFDCNTPYSALKIKLDSGTTVYEYPPTSPADSQTAALLYDPAYGTPGGSTPSYSMPQEWKDELADGTLDATFWVEGTPFQPQYASVAGSGWYLIPEPTVCPLIALGALALIRRRRRGSARPGSGEADGR